jgi:hypothetical protein
MSYSIIIPYRDRKEHLEILLPSLIEKFKNEEYEIIVSEQDDTESFSSSILYNIGYHYSTYENLVLHVADYVPTNNVSYNINEYDCILPVKQGIFLDEVNTSARDYYDIPGGYRKWSDKVDDNFFGAVVVIKKDKFKLINGFNPLYKAWGKDDDDLRERIKLNNLNYKRNEEGLFYVLYHKDNGDPSNVGKVNYDRLEDFNNNLHIFHNLKQYLNYGINSFTYDSEIEYIEIKGMKNKLKWVKSRNYKISDMNDNK